jgi:hypothetical protein
MSTEKPEAEDDQGEEKGGESEFLTHGMDGKFPFVLRRCNAGT